MGTHYIDYESKTASLRRRGLWRIAAVVSSIVLSVGYVIYYRAQAAKPPVRLAGMLRMTRVGPIARAPATLPTTAPITILTDQQRQLLLSSSKSGIILPQQLAQPPAQPPASQPTTQP